MLEAYGGPINNSIPTTIKEIHHARLFALDINRSQPERTVKGIFGFQDNMGERFIALLPRLNHPLWNPLQMRPKLDTHAPQKGITAKPELVVRRLSAFRKSVPMNLR